MKYCPQCGVQMRDDAIYCAGCGAKMYEGASRASRYGVEYSDKDGLVALLLCLFIGMLGIHRFYVGKVGTGILMILTFGGFGLWVLIDLIMIVTDSFRDEYGKPLRLG